MPNTIKRSTIFFAIAALLTPYVLQLMLLLSGLSTSIFHAWFYAMPLIGYLLYRAYRSYRQGEAPKSPTLTASSSSLPPVKAGYIGAGVGFAIGYLTRPEFLNPDTLSRQKAPLSILFMKLPRSYSDLKSEMLSHMVVATVIGAVVAVVLVRVLASRNTA